MLNILFSLTYLFVVFAVSQFFFVPAYLYEELWWLDIPMHIMGGFGVASLTFAIFAYYKKSISFKAIAISFFVVATVWEIYEYFSGFVDFSDIGDSIDTIADYINGLLGASISYFTTRKENK